MTDRKARLLPIKSDHRYGAINLITVDIEVRPLHDLDGGGELFPAGSSTLKVRLSIPTMLAKSNIVDMLLSQIMMVTYFPL